MRISKAPEPQVVKLRRIEAGLTQVEAADLLYMSKDGYRAYERGRNAMPRIVWESFLRKTKKYVKRETLRRTAPPA